MKIYEIKKFFERKKKKEILEKFIFPCYFIPQIIWMQEKKYPAGNV